MIKIHRTIIILILCCATITMVAQSPAFYHLSTAEGLNDNNVYVVRRDQNGIVWIGTSEGLNSFDGNRITTYYKYEYPELSGNEVDQIVIDKNNYIWLRSNSARVTMLDEKRRFHSFLVGDSSDKVYVNNLIAPRSRGIIALKGNRQFIWINRKTKTLERLRFPQDSLVPLNIVFITPIGDDKVLFYGNNRLVVVDYATLKVIFEMPFKGLNGGSAINSNEFLVYPVTGKEFYRISIPERKVVEIYKDLRDEYGEPIAGNLRSMTTINDHQFAISTRFSGLYLLDIRKKSLQHWFHDPMDMRSLGGNNTFRIHYDSSGYLFVTTLTSGLHYFNLKQPVAFTKSYFKDENGEVFDGFIEAVTTGPDGIIWMGAQDRLIRWDREKNITSYIDCRLPNGTRLKGSETIRAVDFDENGNLWVGTSRYGVLILDKEYNIITRLTDSMPGNASSLPSNWINDISTDSEGNKWIATLRGVCMVRKSNYKIEDLSRHPVIAKASRIPSSTVWFDKNGGIWIGSTQGAWHYSKKDETLKQYSVVNGLPHNNVFCLNEDDYGSIYIGTHSGLTVLEKNGKIYNYNRNNGLRNDKCEDIMKDDKGFLWIGNLNCVLRFDPMNKKFAVFEEGHGFSHAGFRMRSSHLAKNGEMFWGSDKGLTWFFPQQMNTLAVKLTPVINALSTNDTVFRFTGRESFNFPYNTSSLVFQFSSGDLSGGKKSYFTYRMNGLEDEWKIPAEPGQVAFNKLPPGQYRFEIKASRDGINWFENSYPIEINIGKPWWKQTWFRVLYIIFFVAVAWWMAQYIQRRKKATEIQKMIDYFAHSGYEHSSVDDILWDIARNCISRLDFEDCVIYMLDSERGMLMQKAAYGPKSPKEFEIANPIEIAVGEGIVGDVAQTGKAAVINDTSKDGRYIKDDEQRFSEITVPIIHDGKVIAVIDSEHKSKNFFTTQHLKALKTIASLCSAKISRAMALDAMKKSKEELMELNVRMAESKFLNLRLQMNPHFLFNSLSSIQHLIVSQQTTKAYKYLTVFSNFLRSLLKYAEMNFIPLDEELKILRMYIDLESLRFDQSFQYNIIVDEGLSNEEVLVPSLMIQPFAENAIWHGLLHKEGEKKLKIEFQNKSDDYLTCIIEDNGIGREKAEVIKQNKISSMVHESKGIGIIRERLDLLQKKTGKPAYVNINDLFDDRNEAIGTRVSIIIPYYNPEET